MRISEHPVHIVLSRFDVGHSHAQLRDAKMARGDTDPTVYLVLVKSKIIYVGESGQGELRALGGFKFPAANTLAYKWRNKAMIHPQLNVVAYHLTSQIFLAQNYRRALEAEVVFWLRERFGSWPEQMTEIHFSEELRQIPEVESALDEIKLDITTRQLTSAVS